MSLLRCVIIDEVEAAGLHLLNKVNAKLQESSSRAICYRKARGDANAINRFYGGVNLLMSGDFWQLHPTGDTAIMTNPDNTNTGDDKVAMVFFWDLGTAALATFQYICS